MNIDKFTITSYDAMTGFDRTLGSLEFVMDELTDFTLGNSEEKTDITGKGGRIIGSIKKNKSVTGSGTNGLLSGGALAAMTGSDIETGTYQITYTDYVSVASNKGVTTEKAVGTVGQEIGTIYIRDENNAYVAGGKKLTQVAADPNEGEFTYDPATKTITLHDGDVSDGTEMIMFYSAEMSDSKRIVNDAEHYSKTLRVIVDVTCQDGCDNIFHGQFIIPRADFSGTFDITGGSNPSTQAFNFTSLPDLCTGKSKLWEFIVF